MDDLFTWAESCRPQETGLHTPGIAPAVPLPSQEKTPPEFLAIIAVLESRRGPEAAITAPAIAAAAGLWTTLSPVNAGTKVRKVLEMCQDLWPFPICGDADGYYRAEKAADLTHYCANLRSRALCNFRRFATVRRTGRRDGFVYLGRGRWTDPEQPKGWPAIDHN